MTEFLRSWILSLTGAAVVCAAAERLAPDNRAGRVARMLCAVVMAAALFSPLLRAAALPDLALELARYRAAADAVTGEGEALRRSLDRDGIERELEAYILDKARALSVPLRAAHVALRWSTEGVWVPESAELTGAFNETLARALEAELGIPLRAQTWRTEDGP